MASYEATRYAITGANIATNTIPAPSVVDGTVSNDEFARINSLSSNAQDQITARLQLTGGTMTGGIVFPDDTGPAPAKITMGAGNDLKVYSDGTSGLIVGNALEMQSTTGAEYLTATASGAVDIYHNDVKRFETSATGVTVNGVMAATSITGNASASSLNSGTIPTARLPSELPSVWYTLSQSDASGGSSGDFWFKY